MSLKSKFNVFILSEVLVEMNKEVKVEAWIFLMFLWGQIMLFYPTSSASVIYTGKTPIVLSSRHQLFSVKVKMMVLKTKGEFTWDRNYLRLVRMCNFCGHLHESRTEWLVDIYVRPVQTQLRGDSWSYITFTSQLFNIYYLLTVLNGTQFTSVDSE